MNICISHAQGDKNFADVLAAQLRCQLDCSVFHLEMSAGDSFSDKKYCHDRIDAIVILLSGESSVTKWCQNMSEELLHEIEDDGTAVNIVMIKDCEIPEFARRRNIADFRGASAEETSSIAKLIVCTSTWLRSISNFFKQELMSGKHPDDCRPQRIARPARVRLERNDLFNQLFFRKQ